MKITLPELIKNMKDKNFREEIILEEVERWLRNKEDYVETVALDFVYWLIQIMKDSEGWKFAGKTKKEIYQEYLNSKK